MSLPKQIEEAVGRLEEAIWKIDEAREKPPLPENQREWLSALTDFSYALSEIHQLNNESIHEKLHALAGQLHLKSFRPSGQQS
ncbi:MAG: hypothetical protein ACE5GK_09680 [Nitrospiria bacterium]